jgi:hypothetical protein
VRDVDEAEHAPGPYRLRVACVGAGSVTVQFALDSDTTRGTVGCTPGGGATTLTLVTTKPATAITVTLTPDTTRPSRAGLAGPALIGISGLAALLAAAIPLRQDVSGAVYDPGGHFVAGLTFFSTSAVGLVFLSRRLARDPRWRGLAGYTLAAGVLAVVGFVATGALVIPDDSPLHAYAGLAQRILVVAVLFPCRLALAARLLRVARAARSQSQPAT